MKSTKKDIPMCHRASVQIPYLNNTQSDQDTADSSEMENYLGRGRKIVQGKFSVIFHTFSLPFLGCFAQRVCVCLYSGFCLIFHLGKLTDVY